MASDHFGSMNFEENIKRLQAAQGDPEQLALVITDIVMAQHSPVLHAALEAAAVPHWFDARILAALLDISAKAAGDILVELQGLPMVEPFPLRNGWNVHETTRLVLRNRLSREEPQRLRALSNRASECFSRKDPAWRVEAVYHSLVGNLEGAVDKLESLWKKWEDAGRREPLQALAVVLDEVIQMDRLTPPMRARALLCLDSIQNQLSSQYYDGLFVNLKANFDDPSFVGRDYLNRILVKTSSYLRIESQLAYFVIGRKGSGKSTIAQVLPLVHPDRYQGIVHIVADDFNLETLYTLYSDQQFRSDVNAVVPRDRAFELTWEALLMLATMEIITELEVGGGSSRNEARLLAPVRAFMDRLKGTPGINAGARFGAGNLFNYAFNATMSFVRECIDGARSDPAVFLVDINVRFSRERYLNFVFQSEVVDNFRALLRTYNKRFLITLDGFDTAFDRFRLDSIRAHDEDKMRRRSHFEVDWLRSLLSLAMRSRTRSQDYFYSTLDFCITAPKDRFMEVMRVERDSYRHWQRWCTLHWSGIELTILLRKRLEILAGAETPKESRPHERLEAILQHKLFRHIPQDLEFEYNGKAYKIPLFLYVLRHTFWRPREVLVYYAAILAVAETRKRWKYEVSHEGVIQCVKATTRQVIESEFLGEFRSTVINIEEIVSKFRKSPATIPYEVLREKLLGVEFKFASGQLNETEMMEKIRFLYEIGFIGVKVDKNLREEFGLDLEHAFYFNEGSSLFSSADEEDLRNWDFVIHPIFTEYLRLETGGHDLSLQYTWDYLYQREAFFSANPNA